LDIGVASGATRINAMRQCAQLAFRGGVKMSVARVTEIISSSKKSFEDAVDKGIARAVRTLKNVEGAWVKEQKVTVKNGKIAEYRVDLKVTFILLD
jgi:dodecin